MLVFVIVFVSSVVVCVCPALVSSAGVCYCVCYRVCCVCYSVCVLLRCVCYCVCVQGVGVVFVIVFLSNIGVCNRIPTTMQTIMDPQESHREKLVIVPPWEISDRAAVKN